MRRTVIQRLSDIPFIGLVLTLALIATYLADVVFGLAWALRALEITSVFDRWMPDLTAWELLALVAVVAVVQFILTRVIRAMQSSTFPFTA